MFQTVGTFLTFTLHKVV